MPRRLRGVQQEPERVFTIHSFRVEQIELHHDALRPGSRPLTIVHLTDLHLRRWGRQHELLIETVNEREVDFVFVTGDFITRRRASIPCAEDLVKQMKCRYGVFACRGNWEIAYAPPTRRLRPIMADWGATLLVNESRTVETHAGTVRVSGLDDLAHGWPDFEAALGSPAESADLTVLLSHAPLAVALLPEGHHVDLVLSGHTHGGQIRIPFLWRALLPRCAGGFSDGLYEFGPVRLHISRGFGSAGIVPVRFNCPAQVAILRMLPPT